MSNIIRDHLVRLLPLLLAATLASPVLAATGTAGERLARYDDGVIAIMKAGLPLAARADRFEGLVRGYYDMAGIAALVVGPGWAATPAADRAAAIAALTRHSAISLARNFTRYGGERFTIDPEAQTRGTSQIVKLTISSASSGDTLLYRMQPGTDGQWRIVDVISGGVSQLAVQRSDLAATVAGGGAAGLAKRLQQVDAKVR